MDLVTGPLAILPSKLQELQYDEYRLPNNVRDRVKMICRELQNMYAVLREVADVPRDQIDLRTKVWRRDVREASYDIEDVIDTFLMPIRDRAPRDPSRLLLGMKKMSKLLRKTKARHEIAVAIRDIESKIQELVEWRVRYKLDDAADRSISMVSIDPRLAALYKDATQLIGIDQSMDEIISMLLSESGHHRYHVKKISIVGAGGLGKTTVAKETYERLRGRYDCGSFVSVGQNPDLVRVFKHILVELGIYQQVDTLNRTDTPALIDEIRQCLSRRRYLIVIDDVWDLECWRILELAFVENNNGSGIIITTRNFAVASIAGRVYKLRPLSYHHSKELFYRSLFGGEGICLDDQINKASDKFLKKCDGIPLALITMASLFMGKPTQIWSELYTANAFGHKGNRHVEETTMSILSLSYSDLPLHLRTCFVYLSRYPDDYVINKSSLIWKWIAEGFIQEQQGKELFELGEGFFNELVSRSIMQVVQSKFDNTVQGFRIHSMVLGLIRLLSSEENFVSVLDEEGQISMSGKLRRLAIHNRKEEHNLGDNMNLLPWLRSFTAIECPIYMIPPVFSFKLLRVLDLESCGSMEGYDLKQLGKLHNLRFIGLSNTYVRKLPQELGHLKFLQTLELKGSGVEELPASMGELAGLMCLNADWKTRVPTGLGCLLPCNSW